MTPISMESLGDALMNINHYEMDVSNWNHKDCYEWALKESEKLGESKYYANVSNFFFYTGSQLLNFTCQDFIQKICQHFGTFFYEEFQKVVGSQNNNYKSSPAHHLDFLLESDSSLDQNWDLEEVFPTALTPVRVNTPEDPELDPYIPEAEDLINLETHMPDNDLNGADLMSILYPPTSSSPLDTFLPSPPYTTPSYNTPPGLEDGTPMPTFTPKVEAIDYPTYTPSGQSYHQPATPPQACLPSTPRQTRQAQRANRRTCQTPSTAQANHKGPLESLQTPSRKRRRGPKNWEYIMRLLASPEFNPSLVSWVNEAEGTFKFNNPAVIAKMWGQRSNKKDEMSYDNFARGLRYHYTTGALEPVTVRQLVYKCGPQAMEFLRNLKS